jgi:hypothetical protein
MKKVLLLVTTMLLLSSCSNWTYKDVTNLRCGKLKEVHVHLYQHDSCEWNCLYLKEDYGIFVDTFRVKYKTNRKGEIIKVKLLK